jgi:hypothetical protein
MAGMPESLSKGFVFKRLDEHYGDPAKRVESLKKLKAAQEAFESGKWDPASHSLAEIGAGHGVLKKRPREPDEFAKTLDKERSLGVVTKADEVDERQHVLKHWFSQEVNEGWWPTHPDQPVEHLLRKALIEALDVAVQKDLPVDTYWICAGDHPFEAFVCWNKRQVTLLILTPGGWEAHPQDYAPIKVDETVKELTKLRDEGIMVVKRNHTKEREIIVKPLKLHEGGAGDIGALSSYLKS